MDNPYQPPTPILDSEASGDQPLTEDRTRATDELHSGDRFVDSPTSNRQLVIKGLIFGTLMLALLIGLAPFVIPLLIIFW